MKANTRSLMLTLLGWFLIGNLTWVQAETNPLGLGIELTPSPILVNDEVKVKVSVSKSSHLTNAKLEVKVKPHLEIYAALDANTVHLAAETYLFPSTGEIEIPITVSGPGEFVILITATGTVNGSKVTDSSSIGVISESGKVWLGTGSAEAVLLQRLSQELKVANPNATKQELGEKYNVEFNKLMRARAAKATLLHQGTAISPPPPPLAAGDINAGDILFFKAQWQAPNSSETADLADATANNSGFTHFSSFPLHGVKAQVKNKNGTVISESFFVNGEISFKAPNDMTPPAEFTISVITEFSGVSSAGAVLSNGGGVGAFALIDSTTSAVRTFDIPTPLNFVGKTNSEAANFVFDRTPGNGGDGFARSLSVFHCVADMVTELRKTMGHDKSSNFNVIYPNGLLSSGGSGPNGTTAYFDSSDNSLNITFMRAYVWDVIGHEFGHMVQNDTGSIDAQGGGHDGSNQFDYSEPVTKGKKEPSNKLALNEGYGTWIGVAFTAQSSRYAGKIKWVGDKSYRKAPPESGANPDLENNSPGYKGEDTERAVQALLWDLHDSRNSDAYLTGLTDTQSLGMRTMFNAFKGKAMKSVFDVWKHLFVPGGNMNAFEKSSGIDGVALKKALEAANSFVQFGMAPHLQKPVKNEKIDLTAQKGPKIGWEQHATYGNAIMGLNKFTLVLYSQDLTKMLWQSAEMNASNVSKGGLTYEYELTKNDLDDIHDATDSSNDSHAVLAILGNATQDTPTGNYLSNAVEILLQDYNRAVVAVVDSSGSNTWTDPSNQRIVAAKESIRRLISDAEAQAQIAQGKNIRSDIAASIDFDDSVRVLSNFTDPDSVVPTLDAIDSSGGTSIDGGINAATTLFNNINAGGFKAFIKDRAAMIVFTDGENGSGPVPVIQAIANATLKGIRVHYGFLQPLVSTPPPPFAPQSEPGAPEALPPPPLLSPPPGLPATIEQAVLQSGGVFARIGDAESQVAFIEQINSRGLTNSDNSSNAGFILVGQANTSDELTDEVSGKSYDFSGQQNERARILVETNNFRPYVTIFDKDGNILAVDTDDDLDGLVSIPLTLPYTGQYSVQIYSEDGRLGLFTVFIDVQNPGGGLPDISATSAITFNRQTGLYVQTLTLTNSGNADTNSFRLEVGGLAAGTVVYGGSGTTGAGVPFVQFDTPVAPGQSVQFQLEYFVPNRAMPAPTFTLTPGTPLTLPNPVGAPFTVDKMQVVQPGRILLEFPSVPGNLYAVEYSDDLVLWKRAGSAFAAGGNRVQWIDYGPPKTATVPTSARFYRIVSFQ